MVGSMQYVSVLGGRRGDHIPNRRATAPPRQRHSKQHPGLIGRSKTKAVRTRSLNEAGTETGYFTKDAQDERSARRASGDNLLGVVHSNPAQAQAERSAHTEGVDLLAPPPVPPASAGVDLFAAQPVQLPPDGVDLLPAPAASKVAPRTKARYWGLPDSSEVAPEATPENSVAPAAGSGFVRNNSTGKTTYIGPSKRK